MEEKVIKKTVTINESVYIAFDGKKFNHPYDCKKYEEKKTIEQFKELVDEEKTEELNNILGLDRIDYDLVVEDFDDDSSFNCVEVVKVSSSDDIERIVRFCGMFRDLDYYKIDSLREAFMLHVDGLEKQSKLILEDRDDLKTYESYIGDILYTRSTYEKIIESCDDVISKIQEYGDEK